MTQQTTLLLHVVHKQQLLYSNSTTAALYTNNFKHIYINEHAAIRGQDSMLPCVHQCKCQTVILISWCSFSPGNMSGTNNFCSACVDKNYYIICGQTCLSNSILAGMFELDTKMCTEN